MVSAGEGTGVSVGGRGVSVAGGGAGVSVGGGGIGVSVGGGGSGVSVGEIGRVLVGIGGGASVVGTTGEVGEAVGETIIAVFVAVGTNLCEGVEDGSIGIVVVEVEGSGVDVGGEHFKATS